MNRPKAEVPLSKIGRSLKPKRAKKMGFRSHTTGTTFLFHFQGHKYIRITGEKVVVILVVVVVLWW